MERIFVVEQPTEQQCLSPQQLLKYQEILKQAEQQNVENTTTKKRERSENWSADEKDFLVECIRERKDYLLDINGMPYTERYKKWVEIEKLMQLNGYNRKVKSIKQQWKVIKRQSPPSFIFEGMTRPPEELRSETSESEGTNETPIRKVPTSVPPEKPLKLVKRKIMELPPENPTKKVFLEVVPDILIHKTPDPLQAENHEDQVRRLEIQKIENEIEFQKESHALQIELLQLKKRRELLEIEILEKQMDRKETWNI